MKKNTLSVVLATRNEEKNIGECLESVGEIADEIIVVDEGSTDKTREIASKLGAEVHKVKHEAIFHKTKQKALDMAESEWILQLDADERVTTQLAEEIKKVVTSSNEKLKERILDSIKVKNLSISSKKLKLFKRHQSLIEQREGSLGKENGEVVAFFVPRVNYFLGKPLIHGGVYPDGVIRLVKRGKARFPAKSVHELMEIDGEVGWLFNDLEHHDSPTLKRYLQRLSRYTDLQAEEMGTEGLKKGLFQFINYSIWKPLAVFVRLYIRHKGFLDGVRGFLWSILSASHFPIAYYKYISIKKGVII
jgi:glycosyltransferase involved in cell wall biosynthesis